MVLGKWRGVGDSFSGPACTPGICDELDTTPTNYKSQRATSNYYWIYQSFTGNGCVLDRIEIGGYVQVGTPGAQLYMFVSAHTGTYGSTGEPTGSLLASSDNVFANTWPTTPWSFNNFDFTGVDRITLENGTKYCLILRVPSLSSRYIYVAYKASADGSAHPGNTCSGFELSGSWNPSMFTPQSNHDLLFKVYTDAA